MKLKTGYVIFWILFSTKLLSQQVSLEGGDREPIEKPTAVNSSNIEVPVTNLWREEPKGEETPALGIKDFDRLEHGENMEGVLQVFGQLNCKNLVKDPLDLRCFSCLASFDPKFELYFSQKEIGLGSCELSEVLLTQKINSSSQEEERRKEFTKFIKEKFSAKPKKQMDDLHYSNEWEDILWSVRSEFDSQSNQFKKVSLTHLRYLPILKQQTKIENWVASMNTSFQGLSVLWKEELGQSIFPEDTEIEAKDLMMDLVKSLSDKGSSTEEDEVSEVVKQDQKIDENKRAKRFQQALYYLSSDSSNRVCYHKLLEKQLPIEQENWKQEKDFLSVEEKDKEGKKISTITYLPPKKELKLEGECKYLEQLLALEEKMKDLSCDKMDETTKELESFYQSFFKGDQKKTHQMLRAYLSSRLLFLEERRYLDRLKSLSTIKETGKTKENIAEQYKEATTDLEFQVSKINDYSEEIESLMPSLSEAMQARKQWLLRGIASNSVFFSCRR